MQKKCAEISYQCNVDVVCIIYDRKFNRFREIRTSEHMNLEKVYGMVSTKSETQRPPKYQRVLVGYQQECQNESAATFLDQE